MFRERVKIAAIVVCIAVTVLVLWQLYMAQFGGAVWRITL